MKALLLYFDLCGFSTQFVQSHKFDRLIFIVHIILVTVTTVMIGKFLIRPVDDKLGTINDSIKFFTILIMYWLSILELYSKRNIHRKFWGRLQEIDKKNCCHKNLHFRAYILKISIYFMLYMSMYLNYLKILFSTDNSDLYYFWFCYTYIGLIRQNRFFYYLFHLEFVLNELKIINREVSEMLSVCKNGKLKHKNVFLRKFHHNRFKWIREFYESIFDMCDVINAIFGWSNAVAILLSFILIITEYNWFYWKIFNKFQYNTMGDYIQYYI